MARLRSGPVDLAQASLFADTANLRPDFHSVLSFPALSCVEKASPYPPPAPCWEPWRLAGATCPSRPRPAQPEGWVPPQGHAAAGLVLPTNTGTCACPPREAAEGPRGAAGTEEQKHKEGRGSEQKAPWRHLKPEAEGLQGRGEAIRANVTSTLPGGGGAISLSCLVRIFYKELHCFYN